MVRSCNDQCVLFVSKVRMHAHAETSGKAWLDLGSISASPIARVWARRYSKFSTGTSIPAQQTCRRRRRCRADIEKRGASLDSLWNSILMPVCASFDELAHSRERGSFVLLATVARMDHASPGALRSARTLGVR